MLHTHSAGGAPSRSKQPSRHNLGGSSRRVSRDHRRKMDAAAAAADQARVEEPAEAADERQRRLLWRFVLAPAIPSYKTRSASDKVFLTNSFVFDEDSAGPPTHSFNVCVLPPLGPAGPVVKLCAPAPRWVPSPSGLQGAVGATLPLSERDLGLSGAR